MVKLNATCKLAVIEKIAFPLLAPKQFAIQTGL